MPGIGAIDPANLEAQLLLAGAVARVRVRVRVRARASGWTGGGEVEGVGGRVAVKRP
jgi:hypothetical protein